MTDARQLRKALAHARLYRLTQAYSGCNHAPNALMLRLRGFLFGANVQKPHRAFELTIKIGGDTWEDVVRELAFVADHVPAHGETCDSTMGGCTSNHLVSIERRPDMGNKRYFEELHAYLAHQKAERAKEVTP